MIDGAISEWDTSLSGPDFYAAMYTGGDTTKAVLSNLFLRYDSVNEILYGLVYRPAGGVTQSADDAWFKEYSGAFGANNKIFDAGALLASGEPAGAPDFRWVLSPTNSSITLGYEVSAPLPAGSYTQFEAHVNVGSDTSSTGKKNKSPYIPVDVTDIPPPLSGNPPSSAPEPFSFVVWGGLGLAAWFVSRSRTA